MVDGGEQQRHAEREGTDGDLSAPAVEHGLSALERAEDGEDRKRREDHAVREAVEHAAPGDRGRELEAARVIGRRLR